MRRSGSAEAAAPRTTPRRADPAPTTARRGPLAARLLGGAAARIARAVASRIPPADLDARDPDYIRDSLPGLWLLATLWFRAEVRGLANVPEEGPVLLVGNHSGGNMTPDTGVFMLAFSGHFGVERRLHTLAHNLVVSWPVVGGILRRYGVVAASPENAQALLRAGAAVLVYPGGDYEVFRPSWERHRVDFGGRVGFVRLALEADVPIVPVVAIGGQETALFLSRGEALARLLRLDRLVRLKALPILVAPPWGLTVGDLTGHLPLPAKITVSVLPPIRLRERYGARPGVDEVAADVLATMQAELDALAAERTLPLVG